MAKLESIYFISKNEIIHPIKFVQFISSTGEKIEIKPHLDFKRIGLLQDDFCQQLEFEMILLDLDQTHQIQYDETIIEFQLLKDNKYIAKNIKRYNRLIIELQSEYYLNPDMVQSRRIFHERKFQEKYNEKLEDYVPVTWKDYKFVYQIIAIAIMFLVILPELNIPPGFAYIIPLVFRIVLSLSPVVLVILLYIPEKIKESEVVKINNM